jgi:phosphatidylserine synthase
MLDSKIRSVIDPSLNRMAAYVSKPHVTGTFITMMGFFVGVIACILAFYQLYYLACTALILNRVCDGLDGAVARVRCEVSDFGGYLDIVLDFVIYAGFPTAMAFGIGTLETLLAALDVLFAIITTGVSFLAYAIIAAKRRWDDNAYQGQKSFFFSRGLMEGTETIIFMIMLCLLPHYFVTICIIFGALCLITAALRIAMAYRTFK